MIDETFSWQSDGRIASVADILHPTGSLSRTAGYGYTAVGRVASGVGPWGNQTLSWDGGGNVTTYDGMPFAVPTASNQLATVKSATGVTQHTYTWLAGGELSQDVGSSTYAYSYNAARRMTGVTLGGSPNGAYSYDFAGHRVWRQTGGTTGPQTAYTADGDGHVQTESSATAGTSEREHIWLDDLLIGEVIWTGSTPALYAVTTGFIDDPQLMTSASGSSVWAIYMAPQGGTGSFGSSQTLTLRYPGQWLQTEVSSSSSNQNGMRDYQPYMGRYMTADPLGIDGGPNPYTYVDGDPLNEADPSGLLGPWQAPVPANPVVIPNPPPGYEYQAGVGEYAAAIGPAGGASASGTIGASFNQSNLGNSSLVIQGQVAAGPGAGIFALAGPGGFLGLARRPTKLFDFVVAPYGEIDAGTPAFTGSVSGTFNDCLRLTGGSAAAGGRIGAGPGGGGAFFGLAATETIAIKFKDIPKYIPVVLPLLSLAF